MSFSSHFSTNCLVGPFVLTKEELLQSSLDCCPLHILHSSLVALSIAEMKKFVVDPDTLTFDSVIGNLPNEVCARAILPSTRVSLSLFLEFYTLKAYLLLSLPL
jgi:hypothetical protein